MSERRLKVSSMSQQKKGQRDHSVASIRLSGKWLEEVGFRTGDRFVVEATQGCVVLRAESSKAER